MRFIDITLDGTTYRARLLDERSPKAAEATWSAVPFEGQVIHGQWSGDIFRMQEAAPMEIPAGDRGAPFQYPGLVVVEPRAQEIAFCYGQGRLNLSTGPLNPIPVAEIGGDLAPLAAFGTSLQFAGAKPITWRQSTDQHSPLAEAPSPGGVTIEIELGAVKAQAVMLHDVALQTARAFTDLLPLHGIASNTHSSGTLIRFWNADGGPEGETPLETNAPELAQVILYPGYIYYLPSRPWRGIRIPYEATAMGGAVSRGTTRLTPIAKFIGDWSAWRGQAERLLVDGAKPLTFRLRSEQ